MKTFFKGALGALLALAINVPAFAQSIKFEPNTLPISGSCGTVAVSTPCFDVTQAWSGTAALTLDRANVTADPGPSATTSLLIDRQYLGVSKFSVSRAGVVVSASSIQSGGTVASSAGGGASIGADGSGKPQVVFGSGGSVLNYEAANAVALRNGVSAQTLNVYNTYTDASNYEMVTLFFTGNNAFLRTTQAGTGTGRALNIGSATGSVVMSNSNLIWNTDNSFDIGANGANRPRNIFASGAGTFGGTLIASTFSGTSVVVTGTVQTGTHTVAGLGAGVKAQRDFVTDATVAASGNFGAIVAGGGANNVPVYYDGTNWRIG